VPSEPRAAAGPAGQAGFTLAEFLVSVTLTLVVLAIAFTSFRDAYSISETAALVADVNENLRSAMNFIVRDLIQTGQGIPTGGIPIPSGTGAQPVRRPSPPGQAYTFPAEPVVPALTPGAGLGPVVAGLPTDMVTVFYADITLPLNTAPLTFIAADGSRATVDASIPITDPSTAIRPGDLILFSNALGNALQDVTRTDGGQTMFFDTGDALNLNQPGAGEGTLVQLQSAPGQYPPTTATRVVMVTYYLDATDPANPRLVRQVGAGPPLAVGLGIENLQLSFDLVDGVTNPTNVKTPVAPNSPQEIRKVNVFLMARSDARHRTTGEFLRSSLSTQVSLRSLSFVDRYR